MKFAEIESKNLNFYAPRFEITIAGVNLLHKGVEILSVTVNDKLEDPDDFTITINNPDLKWLEDPLFQIGKVVEIKMGYGGKLTTMIMGDISAVEPTFSSSGPQQMGIRGFDFLKRLQRGDKFRSWKERPDSAVAVEIAESHGLSPDGVQLTGTIHPKIMQNGESDFKFLKQRAQENGFEMFVHLRSFFFRKPKDNKDPITTLTLGKTLNSFAPELNVENKPSRVTVRGWDPRTKKEIEGVAGNGKERNILSGKQSASQIIEGIYGTIERSIREPVYTQEEAEKRAQSSLDNSSDQFIKGNGECVGIPEIRAGGYITIDGVGRRFSMSYYIESATHKIDASGYTTQFSVKGNAI
ncbi:phage late control D family protein [candidate division KSB1 bacterium]|nr:phage late control D family protein [candidate division KSB1 bacterium]